MKLICQSTDIDEKRSENSCIYMNTVKSANY